MMFWSRRQSIHGHYGVYMKKAFVLLSILKKRAKQLKKEKFLSWHQALDEASKEFGFSNYKNYKNIFEAQHTEAMEYCLKEISPKIESFMLKTFLEDKGRAEINFRAPYFIAKEVSINDLAYETNETGLYIAGNYILKAEFEFGLDENDPISKDARFNDREFDGWFGVKIGKDKKIILMFSDMDIYDQLTPMCGFTREEIEDYYTHFPEERGRFDDILVLD